MDIRIPWLLSRKKIIFNCLIDILLIYILNNFIFGEYLKFAENISIFTISIIPFWLVYSYIIGRYSYSLYITHSLGIFITRNLLNKLNYDYNGIFGFITFFSFTLIISIFFSVFTYNLVEKNGIRLGNFIIKKLNE